MENCGNALSLYQIHSQGANLIVTNVITIMTDLSLFVSYRGMVVDPQQCGILCNTPSSVNSGMHSICTKHISIWWMYFTLTYLCYIYYIADRNQICGCYLNFK